MGVPRNGEVCGQRDLLVGPPDLPPLGHHPDVPGTSACQRDTWHPHRNSARSQALRVERLESGGTHPHLCAEPA